MESNNSTTTLISLTPVQINSLLQQKFGVERGALARYARRIRRNRSTVTRLINGELRGQARKKLAQFLGIPVEMLPHK